jgi:hypothetical protein
MVSERVLIPLLILLFVFYYLVLLVQDYGKSGDTEAKKKLSGVFTPLILVSGALILGGGLLYINTTKGFTQYDLYVLLGYCFSIFILSIATIQTTFYKVNLS